MALSHQNMGHNKLGDYFSREKGFYLDNIKMAYPPFSFIKPVVIFGAGYIGKSYLGLLSRNNIPILALSDNDKSKWNTTVGDFQVIPPEKLLGYSPDTQFIITIMHYHAVQKQLENYGFTNIWPHMYFPTSYPRKFANHYFSSGIADILKHRDEIMEVMSFLADGASRDIYTKIILHHLTWDRTLFKNGVSPIRNEYYHEIFKLDRDEVFVDGGAYDGDTVLKFLETVGGRYRHIFAFEPDREVFARLRKNMKPRQLPNLHLVRAGLGKATSEMLFESEGTISGRISKKGKVRIQIVPLDKYISFSPTFIKLDIEGAEPDALSGAKKILAALKPKLAVCLYHRPRHVWEIPLLVRKLNPDYKIYIRHYSETVHETVCYAW